MRQVELLDREIEQVDRLIAAEALSWPQVKRLMSVPGVNVIVAATFMAAVGDICRFSDRRKLTGYLGLDLRVRSAAPGPPLTVISPSRAQAAPVTRWSRRAGNGPSARTTRAHSASRRAAGTRTPSLPQRAADCLYGAADPRRGLRLRAALADHQEMRRLELQAGAPRYQGGRGVGRPTTRCATPNESSPSERATNAPSKTGNRRRARERHGRNQRDTEGEGREEENKKS